jgi:hypothetical protein
MEKKIFLGIHDRFPKESLIIYHLRGKFEFKPLKGNKHQISPTDFGVELKPSIRSQNFAEYSHSLTHRVITNDGTD